MAFRDFIEEVRGASDIVSVVGTDVELRPAGRTLKGLSPFHQEKTPSFVVWPHNQSWYDFSNGGGLGGDVFAYVQQRDQVCFKEALFTLAERQGIRRPDQDDEAFRHELELLVERRDVDRLLTQAASYYHRVLPTRIREEWFRDHYGFSDETIDELQLGWACGHLFDHFTGELKVERSLALKTGLFVLVGGGRVEDFFRDRLVFPYWKGGQVVYFIARSTQFTGDEEWERSKYKKLLTHSERHGYVSETVRNDTFYNEDSARGAEEVLITEGVTDCISAAQAGIACISPVTTRFRKQDVPKLVRLTRWAKRVVICNDAEASGAGAAGAQETAAALHAEGRDVRIAELPRPDGVEKIDVNEFLKANPPEAFREVLNGARRYLEHLIDSIAADTSKIDLAAQLRPAMELIARRPAIEQDGYLDIITKRFKVGRRAVNAMLREARPEPASGDARDDGDTSHGGGEVLKGEVFEERDHYYVQGRDGEVLIISSFHVEPKERIRLGGGELIVGDVTTDRGRVYEGVRFPPSAWHSKRNFIQSFPNADMQWTGSDDNVQGVLRILSGRQVPVRTGLEVVGYVETAAGPRWVTPAQVLGPDGPVAGSDLVLVEHDTGFAEVLHYPIEDEAACRDLAARALPDLLCLNDPSVVLPVLGWFFASPFKPRIMQLIKRFPILWIWGTRGSGKTSLIKEVFWRLLGVRAAEQLDSFSVTQTKFALIKLLSATNSVPVFLDEYRPNDMSHHELNTIHRLLRSIYGGEVERRGRADLSVVSYRLSAPVCIGGEGRADDAALVDRLVSVTPDPNTLKERPEYEEAFRRIERLDLTLLAVPYIRFALARDTKADLEAATRIADQVLGVIPGGANVSQRCRDNLRVVVLGLTMFEAFAQTMGVTGLPELDVEAALAASIADLMDGEQGAKSPLDLFLETCSVLAYNGVLVENRHWAMVGGLTCLHLRSCWELYLEHRRRVGQPVDGGALRPLRRMLRENHQRGGYVKDLGKVASIGERRVRTIAIDLQQASEFLDVDEFPVGSDRSWGGARDAMHAWHDRD